MKFGHVGPPDTARSLGEIDNDDALRVTLLLKPAGSGADSALIERDRKMMASSPAERPRLSHIELEQLSRPDDSHFAAVRKFAADHGLKIVHESALRHDVVVEGPPSKLNAAFGVRLNEYEAAVDGETYRSHVDRATVPETLAGIVEGVIGLDSYPLSTPKATQAIRSCEVFTPLDLREHYQFPRETGNGQRIAILSFGKTGFHQSDLEQYFDVTLGTKVPSINVCTVDGANCEPAPMRVLHDAISRLNDGQTDFSYLEPAMMRHCRATMETTLDIQVAGAVANDAEIEVIAAPNDLRGWYHALYAALEGGCGARGPADVISISWGASEAIWGDKIRVLETVLEKAQKLHIPVFCSSGDLGSLNARPTTEPMVANVNYPASSPQVIACGGTSIRKDGDRLAEVAWKTKTPFGEEATGGGVSGYLDMPAYQSASSVPSHAEIDGRAWLNAGLDEGFSGRGVPDVAAFADIGYRSYIGGQELFYGGTSASTPLWAALVACLRESLGRSPGWLNHIIYEPDVEAGFVPIIRGNNRIGETEAAFFGARDGWNACCGLGVPNGQALRDCLARKYGSVADNDQ